MAAFDIATLPYTERLHWQSRKDWLTGRVTHSSFIVVAALWGFGIAWNAITGTIATINREKIATVFATDWTEALAVVAVFGLGVLVVLLAIAPPSLGGRTASPPSSSARCRPSPERPSAAPSRRARSSKAGRLTNWRSPASGSPASAAARKGRAARPTITSTASSSAR